MKSRMTTTWSAALHELQQWVQTQEGLELTPTKLSAPKSSREAFYDRVGGVQGLLAEVVLGDDLAQAEPLAHQLNATREAFCQATGLGRYSFAPRLEQFIADPYGAATRPLQSVVIDAVSGFLVSDQLESAARQAVQAPFAGLLRNAYEAWVYLTALLALDPVQIWAVDTDGADQTVAIPSDEVRVGWQKPSRELRLPEAVMRTKNGETFAVKTECAREIDYYDTLEPPARDTSAGGNTHELLCHRMLLVYRLTDESVVAPVVDRKKKVQTHCDLALEVLSSGEMTTPTYLGAFIQRAQKLRTKRPIQALTYDSDARFPAEMAADPQVPAVAVHEVGFETKAVQAAIREALSQPPITPVPRPVTC